MSTNNSNTSARKWGPSEGHINRLPQSSPSSETSSKDHNRLPQSSPSSEASARNWGPSKDYTNRLPQSSPSSETPAWLQQRNLKAAVSPKKSSGKVENPGRSSWVPKTPEKKVSRSSTQIEDTRPKSESAAVVQSLDKEQGPNSTRNSLINGDDSIPKTPESRGLKRKGSDLTSPFNSAVTLSPGTRELTSRLYRTKLGVPPTFNLDVSLEQLSSSPKKPRRTIPGVFRRTSEHESPPIKSAEQENASVKLDLSITDNDHTISSVGLRYTRSCIRADKHDDNDDLYGLFTRSDDEEIIHFSDMVEGDRTVKSSHSGSTPEGTSAQGSKAIDGPIVQMSPSGLSLEGNSFQDSKASDRPLVRNLAPYYKRPPLLLAPETIICEAMTKPLTKREKGIAIIKTSSGKWIQQTSHTGWIYIYQLPNEINTLKIGVTQVSIEGRLDSWTEQCGHTTKIAYPSTKSERDIVPNVYRLEALVHAELAASRLEETGCSCGKTHNEWFDGALAHAKRVVVKWSEWMRKNPYVEVQPDNWHLSPQHIIDIVEMSRPLPRELGGGSASDPVLI